jgi:tetratricopeptide (TPR) repeat protein
MDVTNSQDLRAGIQLYIAQDYSGAEAQLIEAVKLRPDWAEGWSYLGFSQYMQQKFTEAGASLEKAVMMDQENAESRFGLGLVWAAQKRVDAAIACWNEALRIKPAHADAKRSLVGALLYRAQSYIVEKDYDHAEADMDRAIKIDRMAPEAVVALANHFMAQNMVVRAEKVVKEALGYLPNDAHIQALSMKLNVQADKSTQVVAQDVQAKQQVQKSQEVPCPNCKRPIMEWAAICPHCNMQIKAIPSLFATRNAATPAYQWQDVMYYIVTALWMIQGAGPLLFIGLTQGFDVVFSGMMAVPSTIGIAQVLLSLGLFFQNDFAMTFAKWLCILGILGNILAFVLHSGLGFWGSAAIDIFAIGLDGFMIYLLNHMGCD